MYCITCLHAHMPACRKDLRGVGSGIGRECELWIPSYHCDMAEDSWMSFYKVEDFWLSLYIVGGSWLEH